MIDFLYQAGPVLAKSLGRYQFNRGVFGRVVSVLRVNRQTGVGTGRVFLITQQRSRQRADPRRSAGCIGQEKKEAGPVGAAKKAGFLLPESRRGQLCTPGIMGTPMILCFTLEKGCYNRRSCQVRRE